MTIKTLIIDDEPLAHEIILTFAKELDDIEIIGQCYSGKEALAFIKEYEQTIDLLFLDIEMPVISGLDFLSLLSEKPQVVITSAYQEYAVEGFNMNVTDYLLKPYRFDRFKQAIAKVQSNLIKQNDEVTYQHNKINAREEQHEDVIFIKVDKKHIQVNLSEISCFEAYGNYVKVWRDGQSQLTAKTLSSFEQRLDNHVFIRVHKSAIINRSHIDYIEADKVHLSDGKIVAIGKNYKDNLSFLS